MGPCSQGPFCDWLRECFVRNSFVGDQGKALKKLLAVNDYFTGNVSFGHMLILPFLDLVPSGNNNTEFPSVSFFIIVITDNLSAFPLLTGIALNFLINLPKKKFLKSSFFARNHISLFRDDPTIGGSEFEIWLDANM